MSNSSSHCMNRTETALPRTCAIAMTATTLFSYQQHPTAIACNLYVSLAHMVKNEMMHRISKYLPCIPHNDDTRN